MYENEVGQIRVIMILYYNAKFQSLKSMILMVCSSEKEGFVLCPFVSCFGLSTVHHDHC